MTIQAIRTRLNIGDDGTIAGGTLSLDATTLAAFDPAGDLPAMLASGFADKPAKITGASANAAGGQTIVISGTGSFLLGSFPVTLTLSLPTPAQVLAVFSFAAATGHDWAFSSVFKSLPPVFNYNLMGDTQKSLLDYLVVSKGDFLVASAASGDLLPGINFDGTVTVNAIFGFVQDIIDTAGIGLRMIGTISLPADTDKAPALADGQVPWGSGKPAPGIDLRVPLDQTITLGSTMTLSADAVHFYTPATKGWLKTNPSYGPLLALTGAMDLPKLGRRVDVVADMAIGIPEAQIGLTLTPPTLPSFSALADMVGAADVTGAVTSAFTGATGSHGQDPFSGLQIKRAALVVGVENKRPSLSRASLVIDMPNLDWVLFDAKLFVAQSMSLSLAVDTPFSSPKLDLSATGVVQVAGIGVQLEATREDQQTTVMASLANPQNLPISRLVKDYLPGVTPPSDLTIDSLVLTVVPGELYSFSLTMAQDPHPWKISLGPTDLVFHNVNALIMKPAKGAVTGVFSAEADIGPVTLDAKVQTPGDITVIGQLPDVSLSEMVNGLTDTKLMAPDGFDLHFTDNHVLIEKEAGLYRFGMGTTIEQISTLVFVVQKGATGWGFAAGLNIALDKIDQIDGVSDSVKDFQKWFPFQDFTLAVSSIEDKTFTFPAAKTFGEAFKDAPNIKLPAMAKGILPGFYLYTQTKFTRDNEILRALIDILHIPEGTLLEAMIAYSQGKGLQLGVGLMTYLTPETPNTMPDFNSDLAYRYSAMLGTMTIAAGGADEFSFSLSAQLKTLIDTSEVDFVIKLDVLANGVMVAGSMENKRPLDFGGVQVGDLGLALGITWEAVPSFGIAAQLQVDGAFNSSVAILINANNPSQSLLAAALSDIHLDDVVTHMLPQNTAKDIPVGIRDALRSIGIEGYPDSTFLVTTSGTSSDNPNDVRVVKHDVAALTKALNSFDGTAISAVFEAAGYTGFPSTTNGMTLYVDHDKPDARWFINQRGGTAGNPIVTHWQVLFDGQQFTIGQEAQLYLAPETANIGGLEFEQGFRISGQLQVLFFKVASQIEIIKSKGLLVNTKMGKIQLGHISADNYVFALTDVEGTGGPEFSMATYERPEAKTKAQQDPHVMADGQMSILGIKRSSYLSITKGGGVIDISGDLIPGVSGYFRGALNSDEGLDIKGGLEVGIGRIDLGPLGTWNINTGVAATVHLWANSTSFGGSVTLGFRLAGKDYSLPELKIDVNFADLTDLVKLAFSKVMDFLHTLFTTDPKVWAKAAAEALNWATDKIEHVLSSTFGLPPEEVKAIIATICPMSLALTSL